MLTSCGVNERLPDGGQVNVAGRLLLRLGNQSAGDWSTLLSRQVTVASEGKVAQGREAAVAELAQVKVTGVPELHHEFARVTLNDGRLLFVSGHPEVTSVVLFPADFNANHSSSVVRYQAAWRQLDSRARKSDLEPAWAKHGRYVDPGNDVSGLDGLNDTISEFHRSIPGAILRAPERAISVAGGWELADWTIEAEASPSLHGFDVLHLGESGIIDFVCGFYSPRAR